MGYLDGKFAVNALLSVKGAVTAKSYNTAVKGLKNQKTDILCKPFYVGNLAYHIPNNSNIIVTTRTRTLSSEAAARTSRQSTPRSHRPASGRRSTT